MRYTSLPPGMVAGAAGGGGAGAGRTAAGAGAGAPGGLTVTVAGGGIAFLAASQRNIGWWQKHMSVRAIGPDKLNQLRHVRFLRDRDGLGRVGGLLRPEQHRGGARQAIRWRVQNRR